MIVALTRLTRNQSTKPRNYRDRTTCMHRDRKSYNFYFMLNMGSGIDRGCLCPARTKNNDNVAQHGGYTPPNKMIIACVYALQRTYLILDIHVMAN